MMTKTINSDKYDYNGAVNRTVIEAAVGLIPSSLFYAFIILIKYILNQFI